MAEGSNYSVSGEGLDVNGRVTRLWVRRLGALARKSLLVLDAFRTHRTPELKRLLEECKTIPTIIPGGMTSMLQP